MSSIEVVIVDGVRTPFAKAGSDLQGIHPADLGKIALKELLARTEIDVNLIDEVIIGNTGSPSDAVNISRVVALNAGLPLKTSASTVHRNCASAMESVTQAFDKIRAGSAEIMIAGGTENMSQMPLIMPKAMVKIIEQMGRAKSPLQQIGSILSLLHADLLQIKEMATTPPMMSTKFKPRVAIVEGLTDPFCGINMGQTAEVIAKEFGITRKEQDEFALKSHQKAVAATKAGKFKEEITPVYIPPKYKDLVENDVGPRESQNMESLQKLKPFFDRQYGTITVGNSCPITDGAAMLLLMSKTKALELGYKPLAKIVSYGYVGLEPQRMGLGPAYATPLALKRANLTLRDMNLIELNEAFAAQVLACRKAFASKEFAQKNLGLSQEIGEITDDKLNVNGGAIALGHPVGATGSRLILTAAKELRRRKAQYALATLCIGGGQGGAVVIENLG